MKMAQLPLKINNLSCDKMQTPIFMLGGAPKAHEVFSESGNRYIPSYRERRFTGHGFVAEY